MNSLIKMNMFILTLELNLVQDLLIISQGDHQFNLGNIMVLWIQEMMIGFKVHKKVKIILKIEEILFKRKVNNQWK